MSLTDFFLWFWALSVVFGIARFVYLAYFHPYAKYPGPFLARYTDLYVAYHGWKGDIHIDKWRCRQKYGDYVRYGPNMLLFFTAEGLRDIYSGSAHTKIIKSKAYEPLIYRAPNTLTIRGGKEHGHRRRIVSQGVSEKAQRGYEHRIRSHILKFCDVVFPSAKTSTKNKSERVWGEPMDMSKWCYYLSFDIMSDVVFGATKYNFLQSPTFRDITECIDRSNIRMAVLIQIPWIYPYKLDRYLFPDAIAARNTFVKFVSMAVQERLQKQLYLGRSAGESSDKKKPEEGDIFGSLAAAKDPETGEGFGLNEIAAESTTLIVAGSDTTSTAFASCLFYLADNKEAYDKAAAEVRATFGSREDIVMGPRLALCVYLKACVYEALRMSPPVGLGLGREALEDVVIDGRVIPAGYEVAVPIYAIHHDGKYFRDPFVYRPERWLFDDGEWTVERAMSAFCPFSLGQRGCLGKGLANTELILTLATILFTGDFRFAGGELGLVGRGKVGAVLGRHRENEYQLYDHVTSQKKGPFLEFSLREVV